jgi:hypothetical protein
LKHVCLFFDPTCHAHLCWFELLFQRVRRSETVSDPEFDDYVDMTCTMRNWMKPSKPSKALKQYNLEKTNSTASNPSDTTLGMIANHEGPELLMCPSRRSEGDFPMIMQEHVRSSGSGGGDYRSSSASRSRSNSISRRRMWSEMYPDDARQQEEEKPLPQPYSIPVYDIVVVDSMGSRSNGIFLTTQCMGYFEFTFYTSNAHDVFMAFLSNTLPYERITHTCSTPLEACTSSFDVETLTATRMYQRVEEETLSERMRRKFNFMANRIGECKYLCGCECAL